MEFSKQEQLNYAKNILQLPSTATFEECKKNYRILSAKLHPDKGGDPDLFNKVTVSYRFIEKYSKLMNIHTSRATAPVVDQDYSTKLDTPYSNETEGDAFDSFFRGKEIPDNIRPSKDSFNSTFESLGASEYDIPTEQEYLRARESSKKRENIDVRKDPSVSVGNFNQKFSEVKKNSRDLIIYEGVQFTDNHKSAYASWDHFEEQSLLINTDRVKLVDRNLSSYQNERSAPISIRNVGNPQELTKR